MNYVSGLLAKIRWFICFSKFYAFQPSKQILVCTCTIWSNFNFLHSSQWITFSTQLCLVLYSVCFMCLSCDLSSSSCHAISTDIPNPLSPPSLSFIASGRSSGLKPYINTELLYVGSSWLLCFCSAMWRVPLEYITYELVPTSPAVSCMSGSANFDSFHDGWSLQHCFVLLFKEI